MCSSREPQPRVAQSASQFQMERQMDSDACEYGCTDRKRQRLICGRSGHGKRANCAVGQQAGVIIPNLQAARSLICDLTHGLQLLFAELQPREVCMVSAAGNSANSSWS